MVEFLAVTQTLEDLAKDPEHASLAASLKALAADVRLHHSTDALEFATESIKHAGEGADKARADEWTKVAGALKAETPEAKLALEEMRHVILAAHGHATHDEPQVSTASVSRPRTGLSDALSLTEPAKNGHGHEPEKHGEPAKEGE